MPKLRRPNPKAGATKLPPLTFYERDLIERYRAAKFKPVPFEQVTPPNFNVAFLEGLTESERSLMGRNDPWGLTRAEKERIKFRQAARLKMRAVGLTKRKP